MRPRGEDLRRSIVALVPTCRQLVCVERARGVANLLEQLSRILLVLGGPAEVTLLAVLLDGEVEDPHGVLGRLLLVDLEGVDVGIGGIVELLQVGDLYIGGFLEGLTGFPVFTTTSVSIEPLPRAVVIPTALVRHHDGICEHERERAHVLIFWTLKALAASM